MNIPHISALLALSLLLSAPIARAQEAAPEPETPAEDAETQTAPEQENTATPVGSEPAEPQAKPEAEAEEATELSPPVAKVEEAGVGSGSLRDFIDTRITFTIADNDIQRGPEDTSSGEGSLGSPSVPNSLPTADNRLPFDDYERRDKGFENLTHLVVYARAPGFFEGLDTRAALVLRMEILGDEGVNITEDGSYLQAALKLGESLKLDLTAFPMSADRFQLGYSYDASWGGGGIFGNRKNSASPGLRVSFSGERFGVFAGWKTAINQQRKSDNTIEVDTAWGVLGGAHLDVVDELRLEANGGFFNRGTIDRPELAIPIPGGVAVAPSHAYGASTQLTYHVGVPIGTPIDFRLYENDPLKQQQSFFRRENYDGGLSFLIQTEWTLLGHTVQDPDLPSSTTTQTALAFDLAAKLKINKLRLHGLWVFRTLSFLLFNESLVDFPDGVAPGPEMFFRLSADYFIEALHLTPGVVVGMQWPAYVTGNVDAGNAPPTSLGQRTQIFVGSDRIILDPGDRVEPVIAGKFTLKLDLSEIMAAAGEFTVEYDQNRRFLAQDPFGINVYLPTEPLALGFNIMLQARF